MSVIELNATQLGLLFDIGGVIFLGRALFFNRVTLIAAQGGTYWDFNPHLIRALAEQRVDALFGLPALCIGFAFQFVGTWDSNPDIFWTGFGGTALLVGLISYFAMRRVLAERLSEMVVASIKANKESKKK